VYVTVSLDISTFGGTVEQPTSINNTTNNTPSAVDRKMPNKFLTTSPPRVKVSPPQQKSRTLRMAREFTPEADRIALNLPLEFGTEA
jgi:hypothetical protein